MVIAQDTEYILLDGITNNLVLKIWIGRNKIMKKRRLLIRIAAMVTGLFTCAGSNETNEDRAESATEAVMASEPDIIFIGGRLAKSYDTLSEIAPVVYLYIDTQLEPGKCPQKCRDHCICIWDGEADRLVSGEI